jgi:hypothetical protein
VVVLPSGGPLTSQPSSPLPNDVLAPSGSGTSSTKTPTLWTPQSLMQAIEISTVRPA